MAREDGSLRWWAAVGGGRGRRSSGEEAADARRAEEGTAAKGRRSGGGLLAAAAESTSALGRRAARECFAGGTSRSRPVRRDSGGFAGCWRREGPSGGAAAGAGLEDRCGATKREVLQEQQQQQRRRRLRGFWAEAATQARGRRRGSGGRRDGGRRRGGARRPAAQSWRSGSFWFFSPSAVSLFLLSFLSIIYKFC